jgi:hypothetical protein
MVVFHVSVLLFNLNHVLPMSHVQVNILTLFIHILILLFIIVNGGWSNYTGYGPCSAT